MYQYHCLNPIAAIGLNNFTADYAKTEDAAAAEAFLVRSAVMHEMEFSDKLLCVARAGAGVNNIPLAKCAEEGIVVFNTPGANANGVKELAVAGMLLASRDIIGGVNWVQTVKDDENVAKLVEKGKSKFAGQEIKGKKLGIIGLGAIGGPLANFLSALIIYPFCDASMLCRSFWLYSLSLGILNLLPIKSFDGGRIFSSLLLCKLSPKTVESILNFTSFILIFTLWSISIYLLLKISSSVSLFVFSVAVFAKIFLPDS